MKKRILTDILALAVVLVLIFAFVACKQDSNNLPDDQTTDTTAEENEQNIKRVWLQYAMVDYTENLKYTYYYDERGNQIKSEKSDFDGIWQASWLSEYDENNNLTKKTIDTGDGTPFVQLVQIYDDEGNLIEKRNYTLVGESVIEYHYDDLGKLAYSSNKDGVVINTYQYDDLGRLATIKNSNDKVINLYTYEADGSYKVQNDENEYSIYGADGMIRESHFANGRSVVYTYNFDAVLSEFVAYSGDNMTYKIVFELDQYGNPIKRIKVDSSGERILICEYEYRLYTIEE